MASPTRQAEPPSGFSKFINSIFGSDDEGEVPDSVVIDLESPPVPQIKVVGAVRPDENVIARVSQQQPKIHPPLRNNVEAVERAHIKATVDLPDDDMEALKVANQSLKDVINNLSNVILASEEKEKQKVQEAQKNELELFRLLIKLRRETPMTAEAAPLRKTLNELSKLIPKPTEEIYEDILATNEECHPGTIAYHEQLYIQVSQLSAILEQRSKAIIELQTLCKELIEGAIKSPEQPAKVDLKVHEKALEEHQKKLDKILKLLHTLNPLISKELKRLSLDLQKDNGLQDHERIAEFYKHLSEEWNSFIVQTHIFQTRVQSVSLVIKCFVPLLTNFHQSQKLIFEIHQLQVKVKKIHDLSIDDQKSYIEKLKDEFRRLLDQRGTLITAIVEQNGACEQALKMLETRIKDASGMDTNQGITLYLVPGYDSEKKQVRPLNLFCNETLNEIMQHNTDMAADMYCNLRDVLANFWNQMYHEVWLTSAMMDVIASTLDLKLACHEHAQNSMKVLTRLRELYALAEKGSDASLQDQITAEVEAYNHLCSSLARLQKPIQEHLKALQEKHVAKEHADLYLKGNDVHPLVSLKAILDDWNKVVSNDRKELRSELLETWLQANYNLFDIKQAIALQQYKSAGVQLRSFIADCDTHLSISQPLAKSVSDCIQKLDTREGFSPADQSSIKGFLTSLDLLKSPLASLSTRSQEFQGELKRKIDGLSSFQILRLQENSEDIQKFGLDSSDKQALKKVTEALQERLTGASHLYDKYSKELSELLNQALSKFFQLQDDIEFSRMSVTTPVEVKNLMTNLTLLQTEGDALIKEGNKTAADQIKTKAANIVERYEAHCKKREEYKQFFEGYKKFSEANTWSEKLAERSSLLVGTDISQTGPAKAEIEKNQQAVVKLLQLHQKELERVWNETSVIIKALEPKMKTLKTAAETGAFPKSGWGWG